MFSNLEQSANVEDISTTEAVVNFGNSKSVKALQPSKA